MPSIFLLVTDLQLTVSQIVKSILLVIILFGVIINIRYAVRHKKIKQKYWRIIIALALAILFLPLVKWLMVDGALLNSSQYVQGRTIDICQVFALGQGISFEYHVDGKKYSSCNTFHPLKLENIKVPDG